MHYAKSLWGEKRPQVRARLDYNWIKGIKAEARALPGPQKNIRVKYKKCFTGNQKPGRLVSPPSL